MDEFKSEKEMQEFFLKRIKIFAEDYKLPKIKSIGSEVWIKSFKNIKTNKEQFSIPDTRRIDVIIYHEDKSLSLFELKNNTKKGLHLDTGIIQLLKYKSIIEDLSDVDTVRLFLVSSKIDYQSAITVQKYNLPIKFILLKKNGYSTYGVTVQ